MADLLSNRPFCFNNLMISSERKNSSWSIYISTKLGYVSILPSTYEYILVILQLLYQVCWLLLLLNLAIISIKAIQAKCSIIQMAVSQLQDIWVISKALCNILFWHVSILVLLVSFGSRHLYQKRTKNTFSYKAVVLVCMGKKSSYSGPQTGLWAFHFI